MEDLGRVNMPRLIICRRRERRGRPSSGDSAEDRITVRVEYILGLHRSGKIRRAVGPVALHRMSLPDV